MPWETLPGGNIAPVNTGTHKLLHHDKVAIHVEDYQLQLTLNAHLKTVHGDTLKKISKILTFSSLLCKNTEEMCPCAYSTVLVLLCSVSNHMKPSLELL